MIKRIINSPITSNCFIITNNIDKSCIVIDPGSFHNNKLLEKHIIKNQLNVSHVILTHEHFDHIAGVNAMMSYSQFKLLCSAETFEALTDTKKNLSAYNEQMEPIIIYNSAIIIHDGDRIDFAGEILQFYSTPGHSPGSICFTYGQMFFSGDTLLQNQRTRLNLPGSNSTDYKSTLEKLKTILKIGMKIHPGHGKIYVLNFLDI